MNVDEAMRRFADNGEFPRDAMQWALDKWEEASPRLIAKLRACEHALAGGVEAVVIVDGRDLIALEAAADGTSPASATVLTSLHEAKR